MKKKHREIPDNLPAPDRDPDPVLLEFPEAVHTHHQSGHALASFALIMAAATLIFTFYTGGGFLALSIAGLFIALVTGIIGLGYSRHHRSHRPRFYCIIALIICIMIFAYVVYLSLDVLPNTYI
jgi:hypothetical protein